MDAERLSATCRPNHSPGNRDLWWWKIVCHAKHQPPSASRALFPHRSPRSRHRSRSMWRFEASPRRATSKGQPSSPTQHHISKLRLHRTPLCVRDTRPHLTPHGRLSTSLTTTPSSRRESHPPALTDPDVNLSIHPARAIQLPGRVAQLPVRKQAGHPFPDTTQPCSRTSVTAFQPFVRPSRPVHQVAINTPA